MANKTICIEREYGSNGMKIAQWLSKSTGMTVYGRDALQAIAKENDLVKEISEPSCDSLLNSKYSSLPWVSKCNRSVV